MISGTTIAYKIIEHDYCLRECIVSLLPFCPEIIVADCGGDDGTSDHIADIAREFKEVKPFQSKWEPSPGGLWISDLVNECRGRAIFPFHFHLQADEVALKSWVKCGNGLGLVSRRYNFWKDAQSLIPPGKVCSDKVMRCAPISYPSVGDGESLQGDRDWSNAGPEIFHYGFLRRMDAFKKKSDTMERFIVGARNPIWERLEAEGPPAIHSWVPETVPFAGKHPEVIHQWLEHRGYRP